MGILFLNKMFTEIKNLGAQETAMHFLQECIQNKDGPQRIGAVVWEGWR